jgi:hypothetical protein
LAASLIVKKSLREGEFNSPRSYCSKCAQPILNLAEKALKALNRELHGGYSMSWLDNSRRNLLPLSKERVNFSIALKEWNYTGNYTDLEHERSSCELCEHPDIKYQFEIRNSLTSRVLLVGSECIRKFAISAVTSDGEVLSAEQSTR